MNKFRPIRFRGFNKKRGIWLYGNYILNRGAHFIAPQEFADGKTWEDYEVGPDSVGQFTGLTDKNGKEIYEGDIVRSDLITPHEVFYDENTAKFMLRNEIQSQWVVAIGELAGLEVIGNVYDNPGLLKGGKK